MMGSNMIATFASIAFKRNFSLKRRIPSAIGENGYRESSVGEIAGRILVNRSTQKHPTPFRIYDRSKSIVQSI
jgi:hypothetical protein